jgi:DNA adenine methylase
LTTGKSGAVMKPAPDAPKRPALRYYGGKWRLAPWIISFFPPHQNYVEPCGGAASVLLQKPRSPLETYNDLDGNVVNFFRVLRDRPDELIRKIRLTPWARTEYELSLEPCEDEVERARRFWLKSWAGISMDDQPGGFRISKKPTAQPAAILHDAPYLWFWVERLQGVQIECIDALECVNRYDKPWTLTYFDPPYVRDERSHKNEYFQEWSNEQHIKTAVLLRQCQGYVVVSGYACPLYAELYEAHGWQRFDKEAQTNSGGKRIESVWLSPRTIEALNRPQQAALEWEGV